MKMHTAKQLELLLLDQNDGSVIDSIGFQVRAPTGAMEADQLSWTQSYASVVNFYNATGSLARFDNKNILFYILLKTVLRFFSETQVAECKISDRQFSENGGFTIIPKR
jgi:hypothetical protein